jgi:hypothetical protein
LISINTQFPKPYIWSVSKMKKRLDITTPVARLVAGSLYEPRTQDYDGNPLKVKTGANIGKDRVDYSFGIAIAKNPGETHWSQNPFFAPIWAHAHAAFPAGEAQQRTFSWKIDDGDSTELNKKMKRNCDREGFPGNWVMWFSGSQAPRIYNAMGTEILLEKDLVKRGYYVQVFGNVTDNSPSQTPGLYINHSMVAFSGVGPEISSGPDVSQAGFGKGVALPPGAVAYTGQPIAPSAGVPVTGAPPLIPAMAIAPPPLIPAPVPVAPAAPVPAGPQMTAKANGATYAQMYAGGWTDAMLIAEGYMVPPPLPVGSAPVPSVLAPIVPVAPPLPVIPNPAILAIPAVPAAPARVMLPAANGASYEQLIASNWTDALLVQHGMMAA